MSETFACASLPHTPTRVVTMNEQQSMILSKLLYVRQRISLR